MRKTLATTLRSLAALAALLCVASCSTTKCVPDDDQLFIGLTKIAYRDYEPCSHFTTVQEEVEAALATAPNGALFGSSYYRSPLPYRLWIWNAFSQSRGVVAKWLTKNFGKQPVLMSEVNPLLRAQVTEQMLKAHGYFGASVDYKVVEQRNPKKAKLGYTVHLGHLYTVDSLTYVGFPSHAQALIDSTANEALVKPGDPFDVATMDAERTRIGNLLRNHGYFYFQPSYTTYLADTINTPGHVGLRLHLADSLPQNVMKQWHLGHVEMQLRESVMEQLRDTFSHRFLTVCYNGKKSPVRPRVVLRGMKLRPRQLYSYDNYLASMNNVTETGLFSMVDFQFTPCDTLSPTGGASEGDTLDLKLNCVFDKPWDFSVEANMIGKTTGRVGPGITVGLVRRNAFRGGEKLEIDLKGSYEWQTGHSADGTTSRINSYEYGADVAIEFPRLLLPFWRRTRWHATPSTTLKASSDVLNRAQYFKRHVVSGELTYKFQPSATSAHQFSPLILQYEYMKSMTDAFSQVLNQNPYLLVSMADQFVPKMRYTYTYSSPSTTVNPIYWQTTLSEASNILTLGYLLSGRKWNEQGKTLFKNPFAQFLKVETDFRKTWQVSTHDQLVAHLSAGVIWSYGNATSAPYSEQFYVGGANSIRAFNVRSIGPGAYYPSDPTRYSYMDQTGDLKLQANLEYRPRLFGNLYGALFLDAGNVWALRDDAYRTSSRFRPKNLLKETALGTGIGIRYDLEFFVLRLDWGIGIHSPYKSGFYNMTSFSDSQCLHFAIGYPF